VLILVASQVIVVSAAATGISAAVLELHAPRVELLRSFSVMNLTIMAADVVVAASVDVDASARSPDMSPTGANVGLHGNATAANATFAPLSLSGVFGARSPDDASSRGGGIISVNCSNEFRFDGIFNVSGNAGAAGGSIVIRATKFALGATAIFVARGGASSTGGGGGGKVVFVTPESLVSQLKVRGQVFGGISALTGGPGALVVTTKNFTTAFLTLENQPGYVGPTPLPLTAFTSVTLANVRVVGPLPEFRDLTIGPLVSFGAEIVTATGEVTVADDAVLALERLNLTAGSVVMRPRSRIVALLAPPVPPPRDNVTVVPTVAHGGFGVSFGGRGSGAASARTAPHSDIAARVGEPGSYFRDANETVPGSAGGGIIRITATRQIQLFDGAALVVDGANATRGGGGAGGSIVVKCSELVGSGLLSARGGAPSDLGGGGGAGGFIFVTLSSATSVPAGVKLQPFGGARPSGPAQPSIAVWRGAAGAGPTDGGAGVVVLTRSLAGSTEVRLLGGSSGAELVASGVTPALNFAALVGTTVVSVIVDRAQLGSDTDDPFTLTAPRARVELQFARILGANIKLNVSSLVVSAQALIHADGRSAASGGPAANTGNGAGYGGNGGKRPGETGDVGSFGFGTADEQSPGRRGASRFSLTGGLGGGVVTVVASSDVVIDGEVSALGAVGNANATHVAGSGSGGSVSVTAVRIGGTGKLRAVGGNAGKSNETFGGAGGGGRVALLNYVTLNATLLIDVSGGNTSAPDGQAGGSGTIYVRSANGNVDEVRFIGQSPTVPQRLDAGTPIPGGTLPGVLIRNKAFVSSGLLSLTTNGAIVIENSLLSAGRVFIDTRGSLSIDGRSNITVDGAAPASAGNTTFGEGGNTNGTVDGGGAGFGGDGTGANAGLSFLFEQHREPVNVGRSGGAAKTAAGGRGGGAIRLTVSGDLTLNGVVTASGANAQAPANASTSGWGGAGSGGSLWVDVRGALAGFGRLVADGGSAVQQGNAGGGGRVAVYYGGALAATLTISAFGGRGNGSQAGAGTVFLSDSTAAPVLRVANGLSLPSAPTRVRNDTQLARLDVSTYAQCLLTQTKLRVGVLNVLSNGTVASADRAMLIQADTVTLQSNGTLKSALVLVCARLINVTGGIVSADGLSAGGAAGRSATMGGSNLRNGGQCSPDNFTEPAPAATTFQALVTGDGGRGTNGTTGGEGGGRIWLTARETMVLANALVSASGVSAASAGGAGGTVALFADTITVSSPSVVRVRGGNSTGGGGGGAGGNIFVVANKNDTMTLDNAGGLSGQGCSSGGSVLPVFQTLAQANLTLPAAVAGAPTLLNGTIVCESTICKAGSQLNASRCSECEPGFASALGDVCVACTAGSFASQNGSAVCRPCAPGTFAAGNSSTVCAACATGTAQPLFGRTSCDDCRAGTHAPMNGTARCVACAAGSFSNDTRASTCVPCASGSHTAGAVGSVDCSFCPAGSFAAKAGTGLCEPCRLGAAAATTGQTTCAACSVGESTFALGSASCQACAPGTFAFMDGALCEPCAAGSATDTPHSALCSPCEKGFAQSRTGQLRCEACAANTFAAGTGAVGCESCAVGFFSRSASSNCTRCAAIGDDSRCAAAARVVDVKLSKLGGALASAGRVVVGSKVALAFLARNVFDEPVVGESETILMALKVVVGGSAATVTETTTANNATETTTANNATEMTTTAARKRQAVSVQVGPWTDDGNGTFGTSVQFDEASEVELRVLFNDSVVGAPVSIVVESGVSPTAPCDDMGIPYFCEEWFYYAAGGVGAGVLLLLIGIVVGIVCVVKRRKARGERASDRADYPMQQYGSVSGIHQTTPVPQGVPPPIAVGGDNDDDSNYAPVRFSNSDPRQSAHGSPAGVSLPPPLVVSTAPVPVAAAAAASSSEAFNPALSGRSNAGGSLKAPPPPPSQTFDPSQSGRGTGRPLAAFEIAYSELQLERELGRGAFGIVYYGYWRDSAVAVKKLLLPENASGHAFEKELKAFQDEAAVMKGLRPHANVILLLGITPAPEICIVAEFCFTEHDHQLLTNRGFLYLDEVEASDWRGLEVASYDARSGRLRFEKPRRLVVQSAAGQRFHEYADARGLVGAVVTHGHQMYMGAGADGEFRKVSSEQVLAAARDGTTTSVRLRFGARKSATSAAWPKAGAVETASVAERDAVVFALVCAARVPVFERRGDDAWLVRWSSARTERFSLGTSLGVREVARPAAAKRVWCFDVGGGLLVARRATRVAGVTVAATRPLIVGNCSHGSLYAYLHSDAQIDAAQTMRFAKGIASGMSHLHTEGIIHRDLAARNILLSEGLTPKISDFGLSRLGGDSDEANQTKSDVGPLKWMALEAIKNRAYSRATDVWSYGVTVWEIVAREDPFAGQDPLQVATQVIYNGLRLQPPPHTPPLLLDIMRGAWQENPQARPDFKTISKMFRDAQQ
jgi:serine/threonine protein kinase